jgi:hypothetical protein
MSTFDFQEAPLPFSGSLRAAVDDVLKDVFFGEGIAGIRRRENRQIPLDFPAINALM